MSTARLIEILKHLNSNGFKACIFALKDGLPLASQKSEGVDEKIVAAMGAVLADNADRAKQDLGLSNMVYIKIIYEDSCILCKNIIIDNTSYLLAGLVDRPQSDEIDKYNEQLLDWAAESGRPILEKLRSL